MDNTNLHIWTPPRAKGDCRVDGESGCSHISGLFKELDSTLLALMEIRAPSPGQPNGLEGQSKPSMNGRKDMDGAGSSSQERSSFEPKNISQTAEPRIHAAAAHPR